MNTYGLRPPHPSFGNLMLVGALAGLATPVAYAISNFVLSFLALLTLGGLNRETIRAHGLSAFRDIVLAAPWDALVGALMFPLVSQPIVKTADDGRSLQARLMIAGALMYCLIDLLNRWLWAPILYFDSGGPNPTDEATDFVQAALMGTIFGGLYDLILFLRRR